MTYLFAKSYKHATSLPEHNGHIRTTYPAIYWDEVIFKVINEKNRIRMVDALKDM